MKDKLREIIDDTIIDGQDAENHNYVADKALAAITQLLEAEVRKAHTEGWNLAIAHHNRLAGAIKEHEKPPKPLSELKQKGNRGG